MQGGGRRGTANCWSKQYLIARSEMWGERRSQLEISDTQLMGEGAGIQRRTLIKLQKIGEAGGGMVQVIRDANNTQLQVIGVMGGEGTSDWRCNQYYAQ